MNPYDKQDALVLDIHIEELEPKIAPDGGETILPLPLSKGKLPKKP